MAQALFDGHPLQDYFQDSGDASQPIPGGIPEPYLTGSPNISKHAESMEKFCLLVFGTVQSLSSFLSSDRASLRTKAFAERFKYGVISSSLLSPATPIADAHRRTLSPPLPGHLHSRTPSAAESDTLSLTIPPEPDTPMWPITLSFSVVIVAFSARFYILAVLLLAGTLYYMHVHRVDAHSKPDVMTSSLLALQHLISAGHFWDTVINDTFTILENEEQSPFTSPLTPSSPLRVALSTSLLTTQTQCDNVRQLLSAITSPTELAQLSEMYAPPSPINPTFTRSNDTHRPLSHPGPSPRGAPITMDRTLKRSTWNGSYASLALTGPPARRREKRRSDLSALIGTTTPCPARTQHLPDVFEEDDGADEDAFGPAALDLYRTQLSGGLRALALSPRRAPLSPTRLRTTMSPASKYTRMQSARHPMSLSSLRQAFHNALASKRFACAHLLALRFEDDEDEVYWEDVRAVMGLLTSTLVDASARLSEVLDGVEERGERLEDVPLTPPRPSSLSRSPPEQLTSFAPTPSHLARFAAHVGAISSALDDARDHLARCVALLKDSSSRPSSPCSDDDDTDGAGEDREREHPALRAYEKLRRELGIALRECERGRVRLGCIVVPATPSTDEESVSVSSPPVMLPASPLPVPIARSPPMPVTVISPDEDADVDAEDLLLLSTSPPPGIEQLYEADSEPRPRPNPSMSRAERIRLARAKREASPPPPPRWGPTDDVVQELKDVIWKVGQRRQTMMNSPADDR